MIKLFGMPGAWEGSVLILFFIIGGGLIFLIALIDVLRSDFEKSVDKVIWLLLILFLPILGSILYFFIGRNKKVK